MYLNIPIKQSTNFARRLLASKDRKTRENYFFERIRIKKINANFETSVNDCSEPIFASGICPVTYLKDLKSFIGPQRLINLEKDILKN